MVNAVILGKWGVMMLEATTVLSACDGLYLHDVEAKGAVEARLATV